MLKVYSSIPFLTTQAFLGKTSSEEKIILNRHPQEGLQAFVLRKGGDLQQASLEVDGINLQKLQKLFLSFSEEQHKRFCSHFSIRLIRFSDETFTVKLTLRLLGGGAKGSKGGNSLIIANSGPYFKPIPFQVKPPFPLFPPRNTSELALFLKELPLEDPRYLPVQKHAFKVLELFTLTQIKTKPLIEEASALALSHHPILCRELLKIFLQEIRDRPLLDVDIVKALNFSLKHAPLEALDPDDLVQILKIIFHRMQSLHQQKGASSKLYAILKSLAEILDTMGDTNVIGVKRLDLHDPVYTILKTLREEEELSALASYAQQALVRVPNDESSFAMYFRRTFALAKSFTNLAAGLWRQNPALLVTAYTQFKEAYKSKENQKPWFEEMRFLKLLFELGHFVEFERFAQQQTSGNPFVTGGMACLLHDLAADYKEKELSLQAVDFLLSLFLSDEKWGKDKKVKKDILRKLLDLAGHPQEPLRRYVKETLKVLPAQTQTDMQSDLVKQMLPEDIEMVPIQVSRFVQESFSLELFTLAEQQTVLTLPQKIEHLKLSTLSDADLQKDLAAYIPVLAKSDPFSITDQPFDLEGALKQFLAGDKKVFLLLGDSGAGKSTFCRYIEVSLWKVWKEGSLLPLFIPFSTLHNPFRNALEETLLNKGFTDVEIQKLKKQPLLFIFDGYDEIDNQRRNFYIENQLHTWNAKVIITCRTQHLLGDQNTYRDFFITSVHQGSSSLEEAAIVPFTALQIDAYLEKYTSLEKTTWSWKKYRDMIDSMPDILEIIENPFLLRITVDVLPEIIRQYPEGQLNERLRFTRIGLYDVFINKWFTNSVIRLRGQIDNIPDPKGVFLWFCKEWAAQMLKEGITAVEYASRKPFDNASLSNWERFFTKELTPIREGVPIRKIGPTTYAFLHKSLLEYFGARAAYEQERGSSKSLVIPRSSELDPLELEEKEYTPSPNTKEQGYLLTRLMTAEPAVIRFLADYVTLDPLFEKTLFNLIEQSKKNPARAIAAANAITILNAARVSFHDRDFRYVNISGANLSYALLDHTDFSYADLSRVTLKSAFLRGANLSFCNLQDLELGQQPAIYHPSEISSIAISPNGRYLLSGSGTGSFFQLWDLQAGESLFYSQQGDWVSSVAFSPDGNKALIGAGRMIYLWDLIRKKQLLCLKGHTDLVTSIAYSPDGKFILSGSEDKTIRLWDILKGKEIECLRGHKYMITSLVFSSNGKLALSGSRDKTVRLWDLESRKEVRCFEHEENVYSVAISPDNKQAASGNGDCTIRFWDLTSGKELYCLKGHTNWANSLAFSFDGTLLLSGSYDSTVRVWNLKSGKEKQCLRGHKSGISSVSFSYDGKQGFSGSYDKTIRIWDINKNQASLFVKESVIKTTEMNVVSFIGDKLALGNSNGIIKFWDLLSEKENFCLTGHTDAVIKIIPSADEKIILSGSRDGIIKLWDLELRKEILCLKEGINATSSIILSRNGKVAFFGRQDGSITLWDLEAGKQIKCLQGHISLVYRICLSADGMIALSGSHDGSIRVWDITTGKEIHCLKGQPNEFIAIALSADGKIALLGNNNTVRLWDIRKEEFLNLQGHIGLISCGTLSSDGKIGFTGSFDSSIRLWDTLSGKEIQCLKGHTHPITNVVLSHSEKLLFSRDSGGIKIWNLFDQDGRLRPRLIKSFSFPTLCCDGLNIKETRGLSRTNRYLFLQEGALNDGENRNLEKKENKK